MNDADLLLVYRDALRRMLAAVMRNNPTEFNMTAHTHGSVGASRVRESFNPSGVDLVDKLKRHTADLIDYCEDLKKSSLQEQGNIVSNEQARCAALAQTYYETACMYAVKAATTVQT